MKWLISLSLYDLVLTMSWGKVKTFGDNLIGVDVFKKEYNHQKVSIVYASHVRGREFKWLTDCEGCGLLERA